MDYSNIKTPSDKKFGYFFSVIFIILSIYFYHTNFFLVSLIFALLSFKFLLISILKPVLLNSLNILWMKFGFLIGSIVSPIVLGVIFFGIFTPISFITRLFGRDELNLKQNNKQKSYWINTDQNKLSSNLFEKQF